MPINTVVFVVFVVAIIVGIVALVRVIIGHFKKKPEPPA